MKNLQNITYIQPFLKEKIFHDAKEKGRSEDKSPTLEDICT